MSSPASCSLRVHATHLLRVPSSVPRPRRPLSLSPCDWMSPEVAILFAYFYDRKRWSRDEPARQADAGKPTDPFLATDRMRTALTRLLVDYPILGGRFVQGAGGRFEVEGFDADIPFIEATCDLRLDQLPLSVDGYTRTDVLPSHLQLGPTLQTHPKSIFAVQHTRFACGGVCVGMMMHHRLADASGYWQFWRDWAHMYQTDADRLEEARRPTGAGGVATTSTETGADEMDEPTDRSFLIPPQGVIDARAASHEEKAYWVPPASHGPPPAIGAIVPLVTKVVRFSSKELATMKQHAMETIPSITTVDRDSSSSSSSAASVGTGASPAEVNPPSRWVSTFDALSAHLFRHIYRAQLTSDGLSAALSTPQPALLLPSLNWRSRVTSADGPRVPERFFGNCILKVCVSSTSTDLLVEELGSTAWRLHSTVGACDERQVLGTLAWIASRPDPSRITMQCDRTRDVRLTSWNKFDLYRVEFEAGVTPTRATRYGRAEGVVLLSVDPADHDPHALDVMISLTEEQHQRLEDDTQFRRFR